MKEKYDFVLQLFAYWQHTIEIKCSKRQTCFRDNWLNKNAVTSGTTLCYFEHLSNLTLQLIRFVK